MLTANGKADYSMPAWPHDRGVAAQVARFVEEFRFDEIVASTSLLPRAASVLGVVMTESVLGEAQLPVSRERAPSHTALLVQAMAAIRAALSTTRLAVGLAVGIASLAGAVLVLAQEAPKPASADPASIERKLEQARAYVDRMRGMISSGFAELEEARKSSNVSRVNCVSDALGTMKGLLRLAEGIFLSIQECGSRKDSACTEHEYVKISVAFNKCEEMEGQLKGCGGPSMDGAVDGKPVIEKSVDSDIPDLNPVGGLTAVDPKLEVPPSASPFFATGSGG